MDQSLSWMEHILTVNQYKRIMSLWYSSVVTLLISKKAFLEKNAKMQAKIRRRSSKNIFSLKTRLLAEFAKQEKKKSGKGKRRNKKNSNGGKFDSSSVVWKISSSCQTSIWRNERRK